MKLVSGSAIVTGAGQGIGLGIASRLMRDGANVLLFGRTREKVEAAAEQLNRTAEGRTRAVPFAGDVVRVEDVTRAIEVATREFGLPGILVNNAGTATITPILDLSEEDFERVVDINLKGPFLFTRELARALVKAKQPGSIVNISSLNQTAVTDGLAHYCASKAGLANFSKVAASELGRYGIRVNVVAPGAILTPLAEGAGLMQGPMGREFLAHTPLGKTCGEPEDVAKVVSFLCSDLASWITGDTLAVDGGNHIRGLHSYADTLGITPKVA
ncbi:SDR family NAD(P)-dependent oxidoreductase [Vitiosangium sp. GDMCC 1.1324]|uniref:SDR family NAD(P)-dependent oxidoreductase n=1 Tax=Vitiosangium sp. (strain GDMCC 1.1324) TaxID=2138576 RepID=UPI000D352E08|nr:SDR family NAD(P)-dependent oxidoreductase [Vitiosangium sp. GDMCC 1.1324]PTL75860.1 3-oxoacyl-ACP reductase [Vitiosangium sp. GDMCC 1.1324]